MYRFDNEAHRRLRQTAGMSREEEAVRLGKSAETIGNYDLGRVVPDTRTIFALCQLFNVTPETFLVPEPDPAFGPEHSKRSRARQGKPEGVEDDSQIDAAVSILRTGS